MRRHDAVAAVHDCVANVLGLAAIEPDLVRQVGCTEHLVAGPIGTVANAADCCKHGLRRSGCVVGCDETAQAAHVIHHVVDGLIAAE